MGRVSDNWERLVRATLQREQLRNAGQGHERTSSGIAGAVPPSLGRETNIDAILQAADEIEAEDQTVARICKLNFNCRICVCLLTIGVFIFMELSLEQNQALTQHVR